MKKFLLTMFMAITTMVAMAQTTNYTDNLVVTINGTSNEPQETNITVEQNNDGTYTLSLNKFILVDNEGSVMPVGNIVLENIEVAEEGGIKSFAVERNIIITAGDENESDWLGPMLEEVPVSLTGKMDTEKLYCTIAISMEGIGEINVVFGNDNFSNNANSVKYTDNLVVTINGTSNEPQETDIYVEQNNDGTYTLSLNKFILVDNEGSVMPVGNIVLENIEVAEEGGIKSFTVERNIIITAGDENESDWLGPMLEEVPVSLTGKMDTEKLYCTIAISMEGIGEINVVFGDEKAVTSIENIAVENEATVIYDITGRRVNEITNAGIYIVNGKKVFVK